MRIVDQAIKLSYEANKKLFEVHSPLTADDGRVSQPEISNAVSQFIGDSPDNMQLLLQQIASPKGLVTKLVND